MDRDMLAILNSINNNLEEIKKSLSQGKYKKVLSEENTSIMQVAATNICKVSEKKSNIEDEYKEKNTIESLDRLTEFLEQKKIIINNIEKDECNTIFLQLAKYMGNNYYLIRDLMERIKCSISNGTRFIFPIKSYSQQSISAMCQLCTRLYDISFLRNYTYKKSPNYIIEATPNRVPMAINFLTGKWFEIYVYQIIDKKLKELITEDFIEVDDIDIFRNVQIQIENGNYFEMDILVRIGEEYYWIECKTAKYQDHIHKYNEFAKHHGFDVKKTFLVILDIPEDVAAGLNDIYDIKVCTRNSFAEIFYNTVK